MTTMTEILTPEAELLASQEAAIAQYQLNARQKAGTDMDRDQAAQEWFEKHFAEWAQAERRVIDQLLRQPSPRAGSGSDLKPAWRHAFTATR